MKLAATIAPLAPGRHAGGAARPERAVAIGTRDAGRGLKTELRRQVTSAGLGQRLANSWRDRHYQNQKLDAASLVYTKAPQIIRAFDEGAVDGQRSEEGHRWQAHQPAHVSRAPARCRNRPTACPRCRLSWWS
jgi:hypothetical protein